MTKMFSICLIGLLMFTGCSSYQEYANTPVFEIKCQGSCNFEHFRYNGEKKPPQSVGEQIATVIGAATPLGAAYFLTNAISDVSKNSGVKDTTTTTTTDKNSVQVVKPEVVQIPTTVIKPDTIQIPTTIVRPEVIQVPTVSQP